MQIENNLIELCRSNNRSAQKELYILLLPYLRATAQRYIRDHSYMKDILQESFVKIFKSINTYDPVYGSIQKWAARIVVNSCFNYNDRVIKTPNIEFDNSKHDLAATNGKYDLFSDEELLLLLKKMPPEYFRVFNLFIIDGYSHDEIGEILEISSTLSRKRLSRAKLWLKNELTDEKGARLSNYSLPINFIL